MLMLWSHAIANLNDPSQSKVVGKVGAVALPAGPHGRSGLAADWYLGVNAFSKNKEWAAKFIQVVNDPAIVKQMWLQGNCPPARVSVAVDPEVTKTLFIGPALTDQFKFATGYPRISIFEYFTDRSDTALSTIMTTDADPKQVLDDLAVDIATQLKKAGYLK